MLTNLRIHSHLPVNLEFEFQFGKRARVYCARVFDAKTSKHYFRKG